MKSVARLALALLVACVAALPSLAQERRGFMWEARKGEHRVYLVGTIHVGKPDFHQQPADVLARYGEAAAIAVEADISDTAKIAPAVQRYALYAPADPGLDAHVPATLRTRVDKVAARYGLQPQHYTRMKPWMLANTLIVLEATRVGLNPQYSTEAFFFRHAQQTGKPIVELEGVEKQLRLFDGAPSSVQTAYLEHAIASIESSASERELKRVVTAWEKSDAAEMERIVASMHASGGTAERFVAEQIIDSRHPDLVAAIERLATSGKLHLVAVGSLHYFGPRGLLELLKQRGFVIATIK